MHQREVHIVNTTAIASLEYKNDFFSIVIAESGMRPGSYIFCSGISIPKFDPICWGKAGICSNPAFKGLQLLRADVSAFAAKRGIVTKNAELPCDSKGGHGDGWYQENALLIEDASPAAVREILEFSATDLVQTVLTACSPDIKVPAGFLDPAAMQRFLESLSVPNYKELAPPPVAKPQAA
jgi:hypothetical protein